MYTQESIERVRDAIDMAELVSEHSELRRVGSQLSGRCPFHDERTPSFSVDPVKKVYYCFGCGARGDAINFVRETKGLDFPNAVEWLADRYNIELQREQQDPEVERRMARQAQLRSLLSRTADYYERLFWEGDEAKRGRDYLLGRGLSERVLRDFHVGYAPSSGDQVVRRAMEAGLSRQDITAAGLGQQTSQGFRDCFAGACSSRCRHRRRVLGFAGRALREDDKPKYLNTSDNDVFRKGKLLFGLDRAAGAIAKSGRAIVVEGYTDVLGLHQAGFEESVAIMGTSLTQDQVNDLTRLAETLLLALDADSAGQEATLRAAAMARERGAELRVIPMPEGRDPADIVAEGGREAFGALIDGALSVPEFQLQRVLAKADLGSTSGRDHALEEALAILAEARAGTALEGALVQQVQDRLSIPLANLTDMLKQRRRPRARPPAAAGETAPQPVARRIGAIEGPELAFFALCVGQPEVGQEYLERLTEAHLSSPLLLRVRDHLLSNLRDPLSGLDAGDPDLGVRVNEVTLLADQEPTSREGLKFSFLQLDLRRVERELRLALDRGEFDRQRELLEERENVRREIAELSGQTA